MTKAGRLGWWICCWRRTFDTGDLRMILYFTTINVSLFWILLFFSAFIVFTAVVRLCLHIFLDIVSLIVFVAYFDTKYSVFVVVRYGKGKRPVYHFIGNHWTVLFLCLITRVMFCFFGPWNRGLKWFLYVCSLQTDRLFGCIYRWV